MNGGNEASSERVRFGVDTAELARAQHASERESFGFCNGRVRGPAQNTKETREAEDPVHK